MQNIRFIVQDDESCESAEFISKKLILFLRRTTDLFFIWWWAHLSQDFHEYTTKRHKWKTNTASKIWWKVIGVVLKKFSFNNQIRIQKTMFDRLPKNHQANKMDDKVEDSCKDCGEAREDVNHVFTCSDTKCTEIRQK